MRRGASGGGVRRHGPVPRQRWWQRVGVQVAVAVPTVVAVAVTLLLTDVYGEAKAWFGGSEGGPGAVLEASAQWPVSDVGCDLVTAAAMPEGGAAVEELHFDDFERDPRTEAVQLGGASWEDGVLTVALATEGDEPIPVSGVRPHVRKRDPDAAYGWVLRRTKGCGGPGSTTHLRFDLDADELVTVRDGEAVAQTAGGSLLRGEVVRKGRPVYASFAVRSCAASYEWTLEIGYRADGKERRKVLGPFRSAGGAAGVPVYDMRTSADSPGRELVRTGEVTGRACPSQR